MTATYTVFKTDDSSEIYGHDMSAVDAMSEILRYDGHDFRIEQNDDFWTLRVSSGSRDSTAGLGRFNIVTEVMADTEAEATEKLAQYVIEQSGYDWSRLEAMETGEFRREQSAE